jgi:hopanoid biosynthesis associated RND transporter like protein HpnN
MHEDLRHRLLGWWAATVCDHPRLVLAIAALLAGASIWLTVTQLHFQPDRNALVSENLDWNRRYLQYRENFSFDDVYCIIAVPDGDDGTAQARAYADALGAKLAGHKDVKRVLWRIDTTLVASATRMLPLPQFEYVVDMMSEGKIVLQAGNVLDLAAAAQQMGDGLSPERLGQANAFMQALNAALDGESAEQIHERFSALSHERYHYISTDDGRLLIMQIEPALSGTDLEPVQPTIVAVRAAMEELRAQFPGIESGLTGVPVIEADETIVTQRDATVASLIAVVLIAVLMIVSFHSVIMPMLIVAALGFGIAWSFGFLTLAIGHLQLLSVTFTVILLGLGVDFGIHLVSRFEMVRDRYPAGVPGFRETMIDVLQTMGPGIATGAITTAVAFGATLLTDFSGMAEMGLIAAAGIMLCLLSMFAVLPALMRLIRPRRRHVTPLHERSLSIYQHHWWEPFYQRPAVTIIVLIVLAGVGAWGSRELRYDYNLANLLPREIDSVHWFERLTGQVDGDRVSNDAKRAIWFGASVVDLNEHENETAALAALKERAAKFMALPSVSGVGGAGMLFPDDDERKLELVARQRAALGAALSQPGPVGKPANAAQLQSTLQTYAALVQFAVSNEDLKLDADTRLKMAALAGQMQALSKKIDQLGPDTVGRRLATLNAAFIAWRDGMRRQIDGALIERPLSFDDMPDALRRQSLGGPEKNIALLQVYPKANVYDPDELATFVADMRTVDPGVTGTVVQIRESTKLMVDSYTMAGLYALLAVFVLVLFDFQRLSDALLTLLPVAVAFVILMGLMGSLEMPINPANIIVLPLLFGIGVDCGVHILHRYRAHPEEHPPGLAAGTGKGITMTSITTIIGFACLMVAQHRGIASLGLTLAMGMVLTLGVCLTAMPAALELRAMFNPKLRVPRSVDGAPPDGPEKTA